MTLMICGMRHAETLYREGKLSSDELTYFLGCAAGRGEPKPEPKHGATNAECDRVAGYDVAALPDTGLKLRRTEAVARINLPKAKASSIRLGHKFDKAGKQFAALNEKQVGSAIVTRTNQPTQRSTVETVKFEAMPRELRRMVSASDTIVQAATYKPQTALANGTRSGMGNSKAEQIARIASHEKDLFKSAERKLAAGDHTGANRLLGKIEANRKLARTLIDGLADGTEFLSTIGPKSTPWEPVKVTAHVGYALMPSDKPVRPCQPLGRGWDNKGRVKAVKAKPVHTTFKLDGIVYQVDTGRSAETGRGATTINPEPTIAHHEAIRAALKVSHGISI